MMSSYCKKAAPQSYSDYYGPYIHYEPTALNSAAFQGTQRLQAVAFTLNFEPYLEGHTLPLF